MTAHWTLEEKVQELLRENQALRGVVELLIEQLPYWDSESWDAACETARDVLESLDE